MGIFTFLKKDKIDKTESHTLHFPIFCKLHAVQSPDHQGGIVQSRAGDKLLIVHTPTEERPSCVSVYSISLHRVLGFVEENLAKRLTHVFGEGFCRDAEVEQITGGPPYQYYGCNIRIMDTKYFVEDI
jgi:hypothetical protein